LEDDVGALGNFLEVVYGPAVPFRTVRAVVHQWQDQATAEQRYARDGEVTGRRKSGAPRSPKIQEVDLLIWMDGPDRIRIETTRRREGRSESSLVVVNGEQWWARDHQGHVEAGTPETSHLRHPPLTDAERHFFHTSLRQYFVPLALEAQGTVRTAGRECVRVRAVPRPGDLLWSHWLPAGADEYELHADSERGVLLSVTGRFRGEVFETNEVRDVAFDEPLDAALFTYDPRPGEQVRPADPIVEHITLAAAVARMPFTVLVPNPVPEGRSEVMFHPARVNDSRSYLCLMYWGENRLWLNQSDTSDSLDEYEWEAVERGGRRMEISDPGPDKGQRIVRLEHLGTHVDIYSDLDRELLLNLAASLAPASSAHGSA
jgi:outer membrane lipoprotein-sorting protein